MKLAVLRAKVRRERRRVLEQLLGAERERGALPLDVTPDEARLIRRVQPFTMTSPERLASLLRTVDYVVAAGVPGDLVECGVAAGGSAMAMALRLLDHDEAGRDLWLYDTFAGMPEPTEKDVGRFGGPALPRYRQRLKDGVSTWINHPIGEVQAALASTGFPSERLHLVEGRVEITLPRVRPERIAILRLDTDWYESTRAEMQWLWSQVSPGGVVIADDYYRWQGSRRAIDEHLAALGQSVFWARIDEHAALTVKLA